MTARGQSPLAPLLETLEDSSASHGEQTDAYLTLTSRMTGEEGKEIIIEIEKKLPRLYKVLKTHISSQNSELSSAALQALGFCLYNPKITSELSETNVQELLSKLNDTIKSTDKNVRTRALWVISKQTFPSEVVGKVVPSIIDSLEILFNKGETHSAVVDFEALNVIIRLIEQAPIQMGEEAVRWAKLVIPLVVHSAQKVHLRGATALEMGMPLLLQKQQEIASITEQLMTAKLISELQKLFMSKNETYVLKLWPLFVKLLGRTLHRSGSFINSLLQLEELGFRSGSPMIKKIAFIAWKSLIDNFALNPDILCSAKRLKLLMQPLSSIHVRTETLALTKLEVWWYLLLRLGPHLPANFEQVCVPLIQSTISIDCNASPQGNLCRVATSPGLTPMTPVNKGASSPYGAPGTPRMNLSSNLGGMATIPSIQLLGLEMLLHFLLAPEVLSFAKQNKFVLSLEPLEHALIGSPSFFSKHANTLITAVRDSFVAVGKDAPDVVVSAIWKELINLVKSVTESGNKKERPGSEVLTLSLKSLESIVKSEVFPVSKTLVLMEITIKGLPQKVLGSPAYQVANMDILNGTPALFLIQLIFNNLLECGVADERFFLSLETLVGCVLSGPTSPLAFSDSVLNVINQNAKQLENKEHLWRMWSVIVTPLTELINQTNEVNQGDALEHNFSAIYGALTLPVNHIFSEQRFPVATMKTLLRTWSELYRTFARCAALVATAEENLCCEELSSKMMSSLEDEDFSNLLLVDRIIHVITVMVDCIDFSPYDIKYQPKVKSPQRPSDWSKKKNEPLGKLTSLFKLIVKVIYSFHTLSFKEAHSDTLFTIGNSITGIISSILGHISLPSMIRKIFATLTRPLALFYENSKLDEVPKVYSCLNNKLEKLLGEIIACLQFSYTGTYDSELLEHLSPLICVVFLHKSKQIRKQSAQFWNATFAKVTMLVYPEELKPVLRQAKQKFLLLLPGLETVEMMEEESSVPYSDGTENSQLNVKISGMERKSNGRRDSFLAQTKNKKENMKPAAKPKLESSCLKVKSEILLEEEKSTDFVFIPPEEKDAKERILTEHQKEVLKTKRCDIPAMYNNLDVSQDTLFTQYSQEESMEIPTSTRKPKEDSKMTITVEQMDSDIVIPQDVTEDRGMDEHLEKASLSNNECGSLDKTSPEMLSSNNDARKKALISSKKTSIECASSTENSSVISSSSVSNAAVSGTPPHPTSRRQTFITLEKFDGSENRPFSPSPLNNMLSTVTVKNNQETMIKTDCPPKAKQREGTFSKSDSEKIATGTKRSSRRAGKAEQTGNKRSKPIMRSEQEKNTEESIEGMVVLENNSPGLLKQTECVSDNQVHLSESTMEHDNTKLKATMESVVLLETNIVEEKNVEINLESKENTPPVVIPADQMVNEDSQVQITANQKTLRRSSRRRSEVVESTTDSQDKENSHQKKERRKEEEKPLQKSPLLIKDDVLPKHKLISEQTIQENLIEKGNNLHEKTHGETSANAEIEQNKKKPDPENIKSEGDSTQDILDKSSEKLVRGRTRYQTRRASQGLLSSIENSESDSSEAKEEGSRKKRSGKCKNKNNESVDVQDQEEKVVKQECVKAENQSHDYKASSEENINIKAQICEKQDEGSTIIYQDSTVTSDLLQVPDDLPNVCEEKNKTSKCAEYSFASRTVPESNLRTRNAIKRLHKRDSSDNCSVGESSKMGTSDISSLSEKTFQTLECQHKRSRRVRRSKSCDCCGEKSQPQEKPLIGLKNTENNDAEINETKKADVQIPIVTSETSQANPDSEGQFLDEHNSVYFHLGLKEDNATVNDSLIVSETKLKENTMQESPPEIINFREETCDKDSSEAMSLESQEPSNENFKTIGSCLGDSKNASQESLQTKEKLEETPKKELSLENVTVEGSVCKVTESNLDKVETMELDVGNEASFPEQESTKTHISEEATIEENNTNDKSESDTAKVNAEEAASDELNSGISLSDNTTPIKLNARSEISEQTAVGELGGGSDVYDPHSSEKTNTEIENYEETMIGEAKAETGHDETENEDITTKTSKSDEAETKMLNVEMDNFVRDTVEMSAEEGIIDSNKTEINTECSKSEEKLDNNQMIRESDILQEDNTSEKVEEPSQSLTSRTAISELIIEDNNASPQKLRELDPSLVSANDSPSGMQTRCVWSPLASPSTSILKRGLKRSQEDEISSPVNKIRRVSFADPIYQAGLADDIDRRCSIVRSHSSNSSPIGKSVKTSPTAQSKISEMAKESIPCPTESVYPALVNCVAPVDIILPQITSNMWARGLGQLIRAKNIKTIGDLSTLTASEIKTLPIRSPKVSNVKKALRIYHEQQVKSRGLEEIPVFDISEKTVNGMENKSLSPDEERLASDTVDTVALETPLSKNLVAQISALALQLDSEDLRNYSGSQLFEMHEKLGSMANSIIKNLQSRWRSPPHENSV
ncbi:telomere-associated protein RIF1 isoform X3 [Sapajus apella]|uniref:Telomere-associated protein RIF1 n=1 Tax=Sapajus apella TaxID=9515 RepID=A0A6J3IJH6_SAPAP|nr:telomere-associated protein RIF1 isoform X3 [Sapajus apella]XP_032142251.1 telomere-associated protein RIF1 isoform X3 [Sapajus apella]